MRKILIIPETTGLLDTIFLSERGNKNLSLETSKVSLKEDFWLGNDVEKVVQGAVLFVIRYILKKKNRGKRRQKMPSFLRC